MILRKVAKVTCQYCGGPKSSIEAIEQCPGCGAYTNKVTIVTVNQGRLKRYLDAREQPPVPAEAISSVANRKVEPG